MSILSTSSRLIKVGQEYSAGSGISIDNHIISVTSIPGTTYSAGENITIEDNIINSKDWSQDIADSSANAYEAATAQIPAPFDASYISGQIDNKLDSTAFTNWQNSQYATDLQTIEGQIANKLDQSTFSQVSASFLTAINIPESATWNEVSQAYEQASGTYLTSHQDLSDYAKSSALSDYQTIEGMTAYQPIGDYATESFVENVSGEITSLIPTDYATESLVEETSGAITSLIPTNYYPDSNPSSFVNEDWVTAQGYITGVDLSEYAKTSSVLDYIDSACSSKLDTTSFSNVSGDFLTTSFGISESAKWEEATTAYEQNSGTYLTSHQDISDLMPKSESANFYPMTGNPSGFLTTHQDLSDYQTIAGMTAYQPIGDYYSASNPSGFITGVDLTPYATTAEVDTLSSILSGAIDYVSANAGGGGGASYTSPSSTIWISADKIESTDSAYIPSHQEDVLLTATKSWSSTNGYNTLANTNKVYFVTEGRGSAFDNEGTFLNSSYNTTALAETEYPPIKLYTNGWVSVKFSAYSAGIMDAYVVELARKNEVNSSLNNKLDSSAFKGYYPSNNPSGFAKVSDVVMQSGVNLFDGRIIGINNQYLMGCDSAYNHTLVGTSAATGTKTASAYVGTGHQGINIQISARNDGYHYINWTAFSENGSNLSDGQLMFYSTTTNRISGFEINTPLAETVSGIKLYGNTVGFTAYSAYTIDVKPLASQNNITFLSGAIDYVSANAQPSLSSLNDAGVNNIIVTASLPVTPDANTLYFIPET